jgi:hypothetical protein
MKYVTAVLMLVSGLAAPSLASADPLSVPKQKPILTISGKITETNVDGEARFDRAMLEALGMETIETATPWFEGKSTFEGIPLAKLMKLVGASGERAIFIALNDYSSEIPVEDFEMHNVILALKRNGEYMPIRDKGPLFVIYPFDANPELQSQTYYARSVWQVAKIVLK